MRILTLDFETYYDQAYSLSKLTTEEYIRDSRFEVIGVAVAEWGRPPQWCSGDHDDVKYFLDSFEWGKNAMLAHNCMFDASILSWVFGIRPLMLLDTLSMARPYHRAEVGGSLAALARHFGVGEKGTEVVRALGKRRADFTPEELHAYGEYCRLDVRLTEGIFRHLVRLVPARELQSIDQFLRMYTEPVLRLNPHLIAEAQLDVQEKKQALLDGIAPGADPDAVVKLLRSDALLAETLRRLGVEPPTKISPTTGKVAYAFAKTDAAMTQLAEHENATVQAVAAARLGVKTTINESRLERFAGIASRGSLPVAINWYGAHSGRGSGGDKQNLQNLPARGGDTRLRNAIEAPDGYLLVAADSSQIEARTLACVAGQDDVVELFRKGEDVYSHFSSAVYGRTIDKSVDKVPRFVGKTGVLGLGYGAGAGAFQNMLRILGGMKVEEEEAQRVVNVYRESHPNIVRLWNECNHALRLLLAGQEYVIRDMFRCHDNMIEMPSGLHLVYCNLRAADGGNGYEYQFTPRGGYTKIYGGKAVENLTQGLAAYIIRMQMLDAKALGYKVVLQVHDEIVLCVPEAKAERALADLMRIMSTPPEWMPTLPLACEGGIGKRYGDLK